MWLVEVSLQSVVALDPAFLRSLPACCFVARLPDEKKRCFELRNAANGSTPSAHSTSQDNSRQSRVQGPRALTVAGHGWVPSARARLRCAVHHDDGYDGKRNMLVLVLHVSRMYEQKLDSGSRQTWRRLPMKLHQVADHSANDDRVLPE